ncbi:MAG: helix-turn-helix transcriptional regulator [Bacteroidales bacterium]|mgnify:CR=1 FL=1|nr:helix-turn-helix transcriptional regulator [Bacteroidales bacterium]
MRNWLKEAREAKGYTMAYVGEQIGITEAYYSLIERGERQKKMDITLVVKLAEIFGMTLEEVANLEKGE